MTFTTLFGGKVWWVERLTKISEEEVLMEVLVEQMEDDWLNNNAIEQEGDDLINSNNNLI